MPRVLLGCAALAALGIPCSAAETVASTELIVRLNVYPMAAPRPALRYFLLPEMKEMQPGNPIPNYLRYFLGQKPIFDEQAVDQRQNLLALPLRELPAQELLHYGGSGLRQVDRAARMDKPDWQILLKLKTDGFNLLLPDLQSLRALATALQVRFRAEVALHRYDDAIGTAKTMFAMARHMGEHPTLIGDLVGIAIAYVAIAPLEEMLEQPGCPNLYWALTSLPNSLVAVERGLEGERLLFRAEFRELDENAPMSEDQLKKVITHIDKLRKDERRPGKPHQTVRAWLGARTQNQGSLSAARRRLIESGLPEERVKQFPADQVILLDEWRESQVHRDETMKLMNLPTWQFEELLAAQPNPEKEALFDFLTPAVERVRRAQARLEQRLGLLRHVEALRLYAAAHGGKLPAKLADIAVPLSPDPFTGKPFLYKLEGETAHVRGTAPRALKDNAFYNVHFEVTVQK